MQLAEFRIKVMRTGESTGSRGETAVGRSATEDADAETLQTSSLTIDIHPTIMVIVMKCNIYYNVI